MYTLADAIIEERYEDVSHLLRYESTLNQIDQYGFTPLIEAAIANNIEITQLLLEHRAGVNLQDMSGGTALHWAAENNNLDLAELLLQHGADPNAYTFAGQPVLVMPLLRQQSQMKSLLMRYGAELQFAQDYTNAKLLGHMFELVGTTSIVSPKNQFVEVEFEGFYLEITLALITESLAQFRNHFAARELRRYENIVGVMIDAFARAAELIKYQQYQVNTKKYINVIDDLLDSEPLIIPVGYEGHAITFIKFGNILVKCDRREDSRLFDNIVLYQILHPERFTKDFMRNLIFEKQSGDFINEEFPRHVNLHPITEIKIPAQVSGNCSWANVEACIPALFFLLNSHVKDFQKEIPRYKSLAIHFFEQWREWNKTRALQFCIQSFKSTDPLRKAGKAELLGAILFQACQEETQLNQERIEAILAVLMTPNYEYILKNYIKVYCYEDVGEEGKHFLKLLKRYGYSERR